MSQFRQLLPVTAALVVLTITSTVIRAPGAWWWLALLVAALSASVSFTLTSSAQGRWHALVTPSWFAASIVILTLFLETDIARQVVIVAAAVLLGLFWETLRRRWFAPARYHIWQLENTFLLLNLATVWAVVATCFRYLLDSNLLGDSIARLALPLAVALVVATLLLLDWQPPWLGEHASASGRSLLIVISLGVGELFWAVNFLPATPDVKAFFVSGSYYILTNVGRAHLARTLTPAVARRYVYFFAALFLVVVVSAEWFV